MNFVRLAYSFTCASNLNTGFKKVSNPSGLYAGLAADWVGVMCLSFCCDFCGY